MASCMKCGGKLVYGAVFCHVCGNARSSAEPVPKEWNIDEASVSEKLSSLVNRFKGEGLGAMRRSEEMVLVPIRRLQDLNRKMSEQCSQLVDDLSGMKGRLARLEKKFENPANDGEKFFKELFGKILILAGRRGKAAFNAGCYSSRAPNAFPPALC